VVVQDSRRGQWLTTSYKKLADNTHGNAAMPLPNHYATIDGGASTRSASTIR